MGVALDIYGPAGDVCWISGDNYLHQFFLDGLIAVLSIAWNFFVIVRSVCIIKRQKARMTAENGIVLRMMCVFFCTTNKQTAATDDDAMTLAAEFLFCFCLFLVALCSSSSSSSLCRSSS